MKLENYAKVNYLNPFPHTFKNKFAPFSIISPSVRDFLLAKSFVFEDVFISLGSTTCKFPLNLVKYFLRYKTLTYGTDVAVSCLKSENMLICGYD